MKTYESSFVVENCTGREFFDRIWSSDEFMIAFHESCKHSDISCSEWISLGAHHERLLCYSMRASDQVIKVLETQNYRISDDDNYSAFEVKSITKPDAHTFGNLFSLSTLIKGRAVPPTPSTSSGETGASPPPSQTSSMHIDIVAKIESTKSIWGLTGMIEKVIYEHVSKAMIRWEQMAIRRFLASENLDREPLISMKEGAEPESAVDMERGVERVNTGIMAATAATATRTVSLLKRQRNTYSFAICRLVSIFIFVLLLAGFLFQLKN